MNPFRELIQMSQSEQNMQFETIKYATMVSIMYRTHSLAAFIGVCFNKCFFPIIGALILEKQLHQQQARHSRMFGAMWQERHIKRTQISYFYAWKIQTLKVIVRLEFH